MQDADVGVDYTCASTDFYKYSVGVYDTYARLYATRCTSGGKTPNASRGYVYHLLFYPGTGESGWHCYYTGGTEPCFGLTMW
ncbi:MAG: hypothetical protein ACYDEQ_12725 [Desulfocucumaceae bacterium]